MFLFNSRPLLLLLLNTSSSSSYSLLYRPSWICNGFNTQTHIQPTTNSINSFDHFDHLLQKCTTFKHCQQIHSQILLFGGGFNLSTLFLSSRLISIYSRFHLLNQAQKVFKSLPIECLSNTIIWNSILRANITNGESGETLRVYTQMRNNYNILPDDFSLPLVLRACSSMIGDRNSFDSFHCHVLLSGFRDNIHVGNEILAGYGKLGQMGSARQVFDEMPVRSCISWNTMVSGFAFNRDCDGALEMFKRMKLDGSWEPNHVTWTSLLSSYARCDHHRETLRLYNVMRREGVIQPTAESLAVVVSVCNDAFDKGRELHGYVVRAGFENYSFSKNALLCMYGRHGVLESAKHLFSEIETKSLASWNALISAYAQAGLCDEAFATFSRLENSEKTRLMPNVISWTAVISGFASNGRSKESLELFRKMQLAKVKANVVTLSNILSVCADLSALVYGKEIHGHVIRGLTDNGSLVGNGLVNMYAKCGSLKEGYISFKNIKFKELCSWNIMISGYGMHGHGESALKTFEEMISDGCKPDGVTFVSLLSACSHTGLVSEGRRLFKNMKTEFGIEPEMEHYACMVDLLGRAGFVREASDVVKEMPMEPNVCVWGALLNSSRMHKNGDLDDGSVSKMLGVGSATGNYMMVSNIYSQSGRWEESAKVRGSARELGLTKTRGESWIELNKTVHMFTAGEFAVGEMKEVETLLKILGFQMKMEGCVSQDEAFGLQNT